MAAAGTLLVPNKTVLLLALRACILLQGLAYCYKDLHIATRACILLQGLAYCYKLRACLQFAKRACILLQVTGLLAHCYKLQACMAY